MVIRLICPRMRGMFVQLPAEWLLVSYLGRFLSLSSVRSPAVKQCIQTHPQTGIRRDLASLSLRTRPPNAINNTPKGESPQRPLPFSWIGMSLCDRAHSNRSSDPKQAEELKVERVYYGDERASVVLCCTAHTHTQPTARVGTFCRPHSLFYTRPTLYTTPSVSVKT